MANAKGWSIPRLNAVEFADLTNRYILSLGFSAAIVTSELPSIP